MKPPKFCAQLNTFRQTNVSRF